MKTGKLIVRPDMCGARLLGMPTPTCTVDGSVFLPCPSSFDFPEKCPLLNAVAIVDIQGMETRLIPVKKPRRKRENCTHYHHKLSDGRCKHPLTSFFFCIGPSKCGKKYKDKNEK